MTRRRRPNLEVAIEEITPTIAKEMLTHNTFNRNVSEKLVLMYADVMSQGDWRLNGEPIIFDKNGRLQSGQHRLLAVIASDATIESVVVRGAEPDDIYSLDAGRKRKITDALRLRGEKNVMNLASAVTWTWRWENDLMDRPGETATTMQLLQTLEDHPCLRDDLLIGATVHRTLGFSEGIAAALRHQAHVYEDADVEDFFEKLGTGENIHKRHPAFAFRRWYNSQKKVKAKMPGQYLAAMLVKAFNAYMEHRDVTVLSWRATEPFPALTMLDEE